jgi:hypothetical protein
VGVKVCIRYIGGPAVEVAEILCGPRPQHHRTRTSLWKLRNIVG